MNFQIIESINISDEEIEMYDDFYDEDEGIQNLYPVFNNKDWGITIQVANYDTDVDEYFLDENLDIIDNKIDTIEVLCPSEVSFEINIEENTISFFGNYIKDFNVYEYTSNGKLVKWQISEQEKEEDMEMEYPFHVNIMSIIKVERTVEISIYDEELEEYFISHEVLEEDHEKRHEFSFDQIAMFDAKKSEENFCEIIKCGVDSL
jgi:hypothetical protein